MVSLYLIRAVRQVLQLAARKCRRCLLCHWKQNSFFIRHLWRHCTGDSGYDGCGSFSVFHVVTETMTSRCDERHRSTFEIA